ncbi:MAG: DUF167 domain-containing protein [Acidimicrobiales bacterium]
MATTPEDLYDVTSEDSVVLSVHVQPGAGRSAAVGRHGDALKVRVAAPPEGGRANEACARLLAESFGVAPSQVELVSGPASRVKRFKLSEIDVGAFRRDLDRLLGTPSGAGPDGAARSRG